MKPRAFPLCSLLALPLAISGLHADTGVWSGTTTGTWDTSATNWTGVTGVPWDADNGKNNTAVFNLALLAAPVSGSVYTNGIAFNASGSVNAGGTINLDGTSPFLSAASGISGAIKAVLAGTSGFTKTGPGTITINPSTANSLTGAIQINAGQLVVQPSANVASFANTATLVTTGGSLSFLGLTSGTVLATDTRIQTFAGTTISSGHSAISVNDNGASTDTLSPTTLVLGAVTRNAGATLNLAYTGAQTTAARRAIRSSSWTAGGTILDSGVAYATYATAGSTATSPRSGNDWAASDTSGNVIVATYTGNTVTSLAGNADVNATGNTNTTLATGAVITSLRFSQAATRTVTITSGNLTTGGILVSSGIGNFAQTITGGALRSAATVANKDLVIVQNNTGNDLLIASQIVNAAAGATGLTKSGAGRLSLTSDSNNYTGETRINEGTLRIGAGGATGALSTSSAIVNHGVLAFDRSAELVQGSHFSANLSGTGALSVLRNTVVSLNSANNTFSGGVSIPDNGVLKLSNGSALGTGSLTIGNGSGTADHVARFELSNNISVANPISLNGRLNSTSDGIRNVSGNNSLTGTITLYPGGGTGYIQSDAGLLTLGTAGGTAVTPAASVSSGRTLVLRGAGDGQVTGNLVNYDGTKTMSVTKDGAGKWTLSGNNTYTGQTNITAGTLAIGAGGTIGSTSQIIVGANTTLDVSAVSFTLGVASEQTISGTGNVDGNMTVGANGTLGIGLSPGTMTFGNDLAFGTGSVANFEINNFTLGNHDLAKAATAGTQTVGFNGGTLNLLFQSGFNTTGSVTIFDFDAYTGTGFTSLVSTGLASGFSATFDATNGMVTVVPEPGAALLGGLGMLVLLRRRRA